MMTFCKGLVRISAVYHMRPAQALGGGVKPLNILVKAFFSLYVRINVSILENICTVMAPIKHKMLPLYSLEGISMNKK